MRLIDKYYFVGGLHIPVEAGNAGIAPELSEGNVFGLEAAIRRYEKEYLERLLGERLYDEFMHGLNSEMPFEKWRNLKKWLVDEDNKVSPIANYIYVNYLHQNEVRLAFNVNSAIPVAENQQVVSNYRKIKTAHNDAVRMNRAIAEKLWKDRGVYDLPPGSEACVWAGRRGFPAKAGFTFQLFEKEAYGF